MRERPVAGSTSYVEIALAKRRPRRVGRRFAGQPRSPETSVISAPATTHLARHDELRHRDASKRERRRVVAQGDPV